MNCLYLAGPNRDDPAVSTAANALEDAGFEAMTGADLADLYYVEGTRGDWLFLSLSWIADYADGVALLPDWEDSLGARAEVAVADAIGIPAKPVMAP